MASEQPQQRLEEFVHHDKKEHPPVDPEFGKTRSDSGTRQAEHEDEQRQGGTNPLFQSKERRKKEALKQADQYGREMNTQQAYPQTLLDEQNPFGGSRNTESKEHSNRISIFHTDTRPGNIAKTTKLSGTEVVHPEVAHPEAL